MSNNYKIPKEAKAIIRTFKTPAVLTYHRDIKQVTAVKRLHTGKVNKQCRDFLYKFLMLSDKKNFKDTYKYSITEAEITYFVLDLDDLEKYQVVGGKGLSLNLTTSNVKLLLVDHHCISTSDTDAVHQLITKLNK